MIIKSLIVLLAIVICYQLFTNSLSKRCEYDHPVPGTIYLSKLGDKTDELGIPLIKYTSSDPIQCGIYSGISQVGRVTLLFGKNSKYLCSIYFTDNNKKTEADKKDIPNLLILDGIKRIESDDNYVINTYRQGCC